MCNSWIDAYEKYSWTVDLSHFKEAANYPDHFNHIITSADVIGFENAFRDAINEAGSFEVAGEVCFWKNYGIAQSRDRITQRLLKHLQSPSNWKIFKQTIKRISAHPSQKNFVSLQKACGQRHGFATPLTFLAFYNPREYSMVDKHIADWWAKNRQKYGYEDYPRFSQSSNGRIRPTHQSWNAYVGWTRFCRDYAERVANNCGLDWRARDVEMAVWEAQKQDISLNVLT